MKNFRKVYLSAMGSALAGLTLGLIAMAAVAFGTWSTDNEAMWTIGRAVFAGAFLAGMARDLLGSNK